MRLDEVYNWVEELEKEFPVDTWEINGIEIWPLLKINFNTLINSKQGNSIFQTGKTFSIYKTLLLLKRIFFPKKANTLFFSYSQHTIVIENTLYNKFFSYYIQQLNKDKISYKVAEFSTLKVDFKYNDEKSLDFRDINHLALLIQHLNRKKTVQLNQFEHFQMKIKERVGKLPESFSFNYLSKQTKLIRAYKHLFKHFLKNSSVKTIYEVCYYTTHNLAINLAANELGIKTYEIQHGVIVNHICYNYLNSNYKMLPSDYIVWDKNSEEQIFSWNEKTKKNVHLTGNPWNLFVNVNFNDLNLPDGNYILYSLSHRKELNSLEILNTLKNLKNYQLLLRMHPRDKHDKESFLKEYKIENKQEKDLFLYANELPLVKLLKKCNYHVTYWSSTALEASYENVPTIFISEEGFLLFKKNLSEEMRYLAKSTDDIVTIINN